MALQALPPPLHMRGRGQEVALASVAARTRSQEILDGVERHAGPRDEVIHLHLPELLLAVEAAVVLQVAQRTSQRLERHTLDAEEKLLEARVRHEAAVQARDLRRPLAPEERTQQAREANQV